MARIYLRAVTKKYGDAVAVDGVTLEVRDGELMVLVGPSGCGKTTVLRLIAGLESPTSGEIYIGERLVNKIRTQDRNLSMVFESPTLGLYPHMTAYENMAFGLRVRQDGPDTGRTARERLQTTRREKEEGIRRQVERVAGRLHIGQFLQRGESQLSAGQRQEVALGRSIVRNPDALLMDCPFSQIDPQRCDAARAELRRVHRETGTTVLYVTHDQQEAMALGDRIAVMNDGKIQQVGRARELYTRPANLFVAGFIGSPPMNTFHMAVEDARGEMTLVGRDFQARVPRHIEQRLSSYAGRQIVLGLRPESIYDPNYPRRGEAPPDPDFKPVIVEAKVLEREFAGRDIYLHLSIAGGPEFLARVDDRSFIWPPDTARMAIDLSQMHAFDPVTGRSLL